MTTTKVVWDKLKSNEQYGMFVQLSNAYELLEAKVDNNIVVVNSLLNDLNAEIKKLKSKVEAMK